MSILVRIALRNLRLHWVRTLIVGVLLTLGAWIVVVGQGAIDAIHAGMQRSVVDTLSGHLQIVSGAAQDDLELYQTAAIAAPDLGRIGDFSVVKQQLARIPEVQAAVPMGLGRSVVWGSSAIETQLAALRRAVTASDSAAVSRLRDHVRAIVSHMTRDLERLDKVAADTPETARQREDLTRATSPAFWAEFDADPLTALEFLDNRIAPLGLQAGFFFINYVGTDPASFAKNFKLFRLDAGELIPPGERGFMFNRLYYERFVKHRTARRLDEIKEARDLAGTLIAQDESLRRMIGHNGAQVSQITEQLDREASQAVSDALRSTLHLDGPDLTSQLTAFFAMDDANFDERYAFFYREIAPRIRLYAFMVGDTLSLHGQTKSGYPRAVNVKVRGVFTYEGLERSGLAGIYNMMDLVSFRELTGMTDPVSPAELAAIKARAQIAEVPREAAEDALFGADAELVTTTPTQVIDPAAEQSLAGLRREAEATANAPYTQAELENGPVVNIAVFLKNISDRESASSQLASSVLIDPVALDRARAEVATALTDAGLDVKVLPWTVARGPLVSGLSMGISVFFYGVVALIFFVAFIVILNSLLMATMERTQEIGTIRALGAQRGYIMRMFAIEGLALAVIFGGLGVALGALTVAVVGHHGIPATSEILFFVFGGRSLNPLLDLGYLAWAFLVIVLVTLASTLLPALSASRISPVTAMSAKE